MRRDILAALALVPLLAACGGASGGAVKSTRAAPPPPPPGLARPPVRTPPRGAQMHMIPGLESVIGADAGELTRQFGAPRLDVWEGDARKLQFTGTACVLDVFLYPAAKGADPRATYADARRASDGKEVDKAACVAALKTR